MSTAKTRPRTSRSPPAQPLPPNAIEKIRCVPGNDLCLDCRAAEPDWADVQHGSLHCIQCAGRHRGLGVKVSVTRSLTMDNWTEANLLAMLLGGNKQLRTFFETHTIENSDIEVLYRTKQASYYREQLQAQVAKMALQRRKSKSPPPISMPATPEPPKKQDDGFARDFDVALRTPSLGASLTRALPPPGVTSPIQGNGSMALVTKVVTNGPAHSAGVRVGDYVVALNGRPATDYDEVVALFARAPRPLRLTVRRFGGDSSAVSGASAAGADEAARDAMRGASPPPLPKASAAFGGAPPPSTEPEAAQDAPETAPPPPAPPPPPDSPPTPKRKPPEPEVLEASFGPGPLGLTVDRDAAGAPCVTRVAEDGQAAKAGVRVGDVVVALNGTSAPAYEAVVRDLPALPRPTLLKFRRPQQIVIDDALKPSPTKPPPVTRARGPAFNGKGSKVFTDELDDGSTTKVGLPSPDDANEYDVTFESGPLGFRLEERGGLVAVSLVTSVDAAGPAAAAGVRAGDVVLGVNGERYLSHAHTAATLKHGRRPVELRLRHSD
jgi:S1-C subfamily serine protease